MTDGVTSVTPVTPAQRDFPHVCASSVSTSNRIIAPSLPQDLRLEVIHAFHTHAGQATGVLRLTIRSPIEQVVLEQHLCYVPGQKSFYMLSYYLPSQARTRACSPS